VQRVCRQEEVELAYPRGLATTSTGQLIVAESDGARVRIIEDMRVNSSGAVASWTGTMSTLSAADSGAASLSSALASPAGLVLVPTLGGYVLIASDSGAHAMRLLFVTERLDEVEEAAAGEC